MGVGMLVVSRYTTKDFSTVKDSMSGWMLTNTKTNMVNDQRVFYGES